MCIGALVGPGQATMMSSPLRLLRCGVGAAVEHVVALVGVGLQRLQALLGLDQFVGQPVDGRFEFPHFGLEFVHSVPSHTFDWRPRTYKSASDIDNTSDTSRPPPFARVVRRFASRIRPPISVGCHTGRG
ncbi:hypothetical protein BRC63_01645 [Halobacteriales archaeon QH_10_70_21]|nr:MAG: hypothetical protein BRC63_01645 [Halobacteriales archaeon QH_10_70_21]